MSQYASIDPVLSQWAEAHLLTWLSDYQDYEVRTFFLNPSRRDRVQIWVDPPQDGCATVGVGQNRKGLPRLNRVEKITCTVSDLSNALDKALDLAEIWLGEEAG